MRVQSDANTTGTVTWLHGDPTGTFRMLGSASVATDANGNKIAGSDTRYMPFGEPRPGWKGTGLPTDWRFTGHISIAGGLFSMNACTYDPPGRFISVGALPTDSKHPAAYNRYTLVGNNPLRYTDPDGHCWPICIVLAGAEIGASVGAG